MNLNRFQNVARRPLMTVHGLSAVLSSCAFVTSLYLEDGGGGVRSGGAGGGGGRAGSPLSGDLLAEIVAEARLSFLASLGCIF